MVTPSTISKKPTVQRLTPSEYNFPKQIREGDENLKKPYIAGYYSFNSMQTYGFDGYPNDTRGDYWD